MPGRLGILVYLRGSQPEQYHWLANRPVDSQSLKAFLLLLSAEPHACCGHISRPLHGSLERARQPKTNLTLLFPACRGKRQVVCMYEDRTFLATGCLTNSMDSCSSDLKLDKLRPVHTLLQNLQVKNSFKRVKGDSPLPFHMKQATLWLQQLFCHSSSVGSVVMSIPYRGGVVTFGVFQAGTTNNMHR